MGGMNEERRMKKEFVRRFVFLRDREFLWISLPFSRFDQMLIFYRIDALHGYEVRLCAVRNVKEMTQVGFVLRDALHIVCEGCNIGWLTIGFGEDFRTAEIGIAVVDIIFKELCGVAVAVVSHDHEYLTGAFRGFFHFRYFFNGNGVGLFRENVKSLVQRVNGDDGVEIVRLADVHVIKTLNVEQVVIVGKRGEVIGELIAFF